MGGAALNWPVPVSDKSLRLRISNEHRSALETDVSIPRTVVRMAKDVAASARLTSNQRSQWISRLADRGGEFWPNLRDGQSIQLDHRLRMGTEGALLSGAVTGDGGRERFWIRWSPDDQSAAAKQTYDYMNWWRKRHSDLANRVPRILDYWPADNALVFEHAPGKPLSRAMADSTGARENDFQRVEHGASQLGAWLQRYSRGLEYYDADVRDAAVAEVTRTPDGKLRVNARALMARRVDRAHLDALELAACGLTIGESWTQRQPDRVAATVGDDVPAGFVHGDLKCDNVLCNDVGFSVIDWWLAPRASWPLADVGVFAASLRLMDDQRIASRVWTRFANAYFDRDVTAATERQIDLLAVMTGMSHLAGKMRSTTGRLLERTTCNTLLKRLQSNTAIGQAGRCNGGE